MNKLLLAFLTLLIFAFSANANDTSITIRAEVVQLMGIRVIEPSYDGMKIASAEFSYLDSTPKLEPFCTGGCILNVEEFIDNSFEENTNVSLISYGFADEVLMIGTIQ